MEHVINSTTFQRGFRSIAQKVHAGENHYVIKVSGIEVGAFIPMDEYKEFMKERDEREWEAQAREERLQQFEDAAQRMGKRLAALGFSDEELEAQIEAGRKRYHRSHRSKKAHDQGPTCKTPAGHGRCQDSCGRHRLAPFPL